MSKRLQKLALAGACSFFSILMIESHSAQAKPPWAGDNCPPQVSNAFNGNGSENQCAAVIVVLKGGGTEICGCKERGVEKYDSVNDKIFPENQRELRSIRMSITKTIDKTDPVDPCQTINVNGVPITYCW